MPLDRLEKRILADASSRAEAIRADAKKQAEKIIDEAEAQAKEMEADAEKRARDEAARHEAELMEGLELQARNMLLEARNRAMERALARLKRLVARRIKKKGYERLISMAIEEAEKVAPQEGLTLVIGKNEARMVRNFAGRIKYGKADDGFELRNRDGSVRLAVTIDDLFEKNRQDIETLLLRAAFANLSGAAKRGRRGG
jgi:vacuolar-type H+-ATPase subunit E/Vma4